MIKDYPPYLDYPKPRKPQTHADELRAMSDEELAHFMMQTTDCPCVARANGCCRSDISCQKAWLDWLRQEAKE